jgi:hypothetical protein
MIEKVLKFALHYPLAIIALTLGTAGFGIYAFYRLPIDAVALGRRGLGYEKLDQVMMEHLLGVRG